MEENELLEQIADNERIIGQLDKRIVDLQFKARHAEALTAENAQLRAQLEGMAGRRDAYMSIILGVIGRNWLDIKGEKPDLYRYQQTAISLALLNSISAGAIETDAEAAAIVAICEEWQIPNVFDTWDTDMRRAVAQNRQALGLDAD